jgi:signal transduction histidine kinase
MRISSGLYATPAITFLGPGFAFAGLFLEGLSLWPFVYFASLAGHILHGSSFITMLIMPLAHVVQAALGAYLLRRYPLDPLFRKTGDMLFFLATAALVAFTVPVFSSMAGFLNNLIYGVNPFTSTFVSRYVAMLFSILLIAPFLIRWFAKPRFTRTGLHIFEILASFSFLILIGYFLFFSETPSVAGFSLVYFLLAPLFWIALRLRPRFLTLALLILAILGTAGAFFGLSALSGEALGMRIFNTQVLLIIISIIFYILVSIEEERRVTTALMQSQVNTLRNALSELRDQNQAKTEFIATLAHELRNPLAPIMSAIELLRLKGSSDQESREAVHTMEDRMKSVRRLLDDLLDVSRIGEKKLSLEKEVVDLREVVRRAAQSVEMYYRERRQLLSLSLPEEPTYVEGDPVRLEQIAANLLVNASKFSNSRDRVTLSIVEHEVVIELKVIDRGIGIDPSMQEHIFEPFRQVSGKGRAAGGVGIGLSLVKTLAELHGGSVRVKSEGKGRGAEFTVMLPRASEKKIKAQEAANTGKTKGRKDAKSALSQGDYILIVDDNDAAAAGIGRLLELTGRTVDYAYDGDQAIQKVAAAAPKAILLDIGLPDMDGYEVARRIRTGGFKGKLIALTGYSLEEAQKKAVDAGFDHYLVKPVGLADLKTVL